MHQVRLQNDSLMEIATFLVRRWSGRQDMTVQISDRVGTRTRLADGKVIITTPDKRIGDDFQRYRQFRASLWYESMRARHCQKILSNDHAFGFILNTMETRRVEGLGRSLWRGMDGEIIFNYACMLAERPQLHSVYGSARIVEAFYQQFMFGTIKGEVQASRFEKIREAAAYACDVTDQAVREECSTKWLESHVSKIIRILDIDSLMTIPVSLPFMKAGMALTEEELRRIIKIVADNREGDFGTADPDAVMKGENLHDEYKILLDETHKNQNKGLAPEPVGIQTPSARDVDETAMYDMRLIGGLKTRMKEWKSGWTEQHVRAGDEFDEEGYVEGGKPFLTDIRKSIKTKIVILLDHSSSISSDALEYKKATLALCEVLSYLKVKFAVYAFSTQNRTIVCWSVKPDGVKWNRTTARRLAQIVANGSTPLAEIYDRIFPVMQTRSPDILLTLTDGEPSDPDAVRGMIKALKSLGISMVALGLGPNTVRATMIAGNLRRLGYEKTVAVSRLRDIPSRVMGILQT